MRKASMARFRSRYVSWVSYSVFLVIFIIVVSSVFFRVLKDVPFRQAFILTTEPMRIISWDKQRISMQVVTIPKNILISGVLGYGQYSLQAIEALDLMDKKYGVLLGQSMAQSIGIPIKGVIFTDVSTMNEPVLSTLKKIFSWSSLVSKLFGRVGVSVSFSDWVHIVFAVHALGTDDIETLDLSTAVSDIRRPDGEVIQVLDPQKVDFILGNALHDASLRNEYKTVTIINTTPVMGIGTNLARIVNRFGIQVVSVDSEIDAIDNCQLQTSKKIKNTLTYQFLKTYLNCDEKLFDDEDNGVSDITLRIGTSFASLFDERKE